jgi:tryptophan-rich sensory protein
VRGVCAGRCRGTNVTTDDRESDLFVSETTDPTRAPWKGWLDDEPEIEEPCTPDPAPVFRKTRAEQFRAALAFAGAALVVAAAAVAVSALDRSWLDEQIHPFLAPPGLAVVVVSALVLVATTIAGWLAWRASGGRLVTTVWSVTVGLWAVWALLFFTGSTGGALVVGAFAVAAVVVTTIQMWRAALAAGLLMLLALAWVPFMFVVNTGYAALNFR